MIEQKRKKMSSSNSIASNSNATTAMTNECSNSNSNQYESSTRTGSSKHVTATTIQSFSLQHQQQQLLMWSSVLVWPAMMALPLLLTMQYSPFHYTKLFPVEWYDTTNNSTTTTAGRKPIGLILGILSVAIGQAGVCIFFYLYKYGYLSSSSSSIIHNDQKTSSSSSSSNEPTSIQRKGAVKYEYMEGILTHISQPEGFVVLTAYLTITWMMNLLPNSYYQFNNIDDSSNSTMISSYGSIQYKELFLCLVVQDGIQYVMHRLEHDMSPAFYQKSHKPHHKFLNPRLFDAFNGSLTDTICMIIIPLYMTANIVRTANVWTYMAFGSTYACWLTLIHSEYVFVWDPYFRCMGFGTPADHHVHHAFFKYNYGHLFMWFDMLAGTYHNPNRYAPKNFNVGV